MRKPEHDYQIYTVSLNDGRRLIAEPPLDVVVSYRDNLWIANVAALTGDYPLYSESLDGMQRYVSAHIRMSWRLYAQVDIGKLAPDGIEFRETLLKTFRVERISIVHPTPDSAEFFVDGSVYNIKREEILPGIQMLNMESAFYQRFGRGDDELPLIWASFKANDNKLSKEE